jgi:hypothetical protein
MEFCFWLIFNKTGEMRMSRGESSLSPHERAMHCVARIPLALFRTPSLKAEISVPAPGVDLSGVISSEVIMAAENALKEVLGVRVVLTVDEQPPPEWDGMKAGGNRS